MRYMRNVLRAGELAIDALAIGALAIGALAIGALAIGALAIGALAIGAAAAQATIDANHASLAEIERIQGVGTSVAANLLEERNKRAFEDWNDLIRRVKGVGRANAARFSADGLRVNGVEFQSAAASAKASGVLPNK